MSEGGRGVALQIAHDRYRPGAVKDKFAAANKRTTFFAQIETAEGVRNADAIAAVPGVDCLWVGHFDLTNFLGIPGQFEHRDFKKAMDTIINAAKKNKKSEARKRDARQSAKSAAGAGRGTKAGKKRRRAA